MTAGPRMLAVFDTQAGTAGTVPLADVAADIRRYEMTMPAAGQQRCPGCGQDGQAAPCVFCGQLQDPSCTYGTSYDPAGEDAPGRWVCSGCGAVTADDPAAPRLIPAGAVPWRN